jgi:TonB family protein
VTRPPPSLAILFTAVQGLLWADLTIASACRPSPSDHSIAKQEDRQIHAGTIAGCGRLIHYVRPEYPKALRQRRVQGVVRIRVTVGKDGALKTLLPLAGPKELLPLAVSAVEKWRYEPCRLEGAPVEFIIDVVVPFSLGQ